MESFGPFLLGSALTIIAYPLARVAYRIFPYLTPPILPKTSTGYVIVAGCTDGIGQQYLKWFQQRNYGLIAIGRNDTKLQSLKRTYPNIVTLQLDFKDQILTTHPPQNTANTIKQILLERHPLNPPTILGLVNSIGAAHFCKYPSMTANQIDSLHNINLNSLHYLIHLSRQLTELGCQSSSPFLINLSSATANYPIPYSSIYVATKAYLSNFIKALALEQPTIQLLDVQPWYVKTKMIAFRQAIHAVQPRTIVEGSMKVLGKTLTCSGCVKHEIMDQFEWVVRGRIRKDVEDLMVRYQRNEEAKRKRRQK